MNRGDNTAHLYLACPEHFVVCVVVVLQFVDQGCHRFQRAHSATGKNNRKSVTVMLQTLCDSRKLRPLLLFLLLCIMMLQPL